jgi:hypothetical protein
MTTPAQPNPNPLPAILVYGTPGSPELTQASWFRAEDKEAVKAAAEELKFSVIELQTDAEKALAAGVHEGVLKGSGGRMIVGSVAAEIYRRVEEYARKGASASDPSQPETPQRRRPNPRQNKARTPALRVRPRLHPLAQAWPRRRSASRMAPPSEKPCESARGSWPPTGTTSASSRGFGSPPSSGSNAASSRSNGSTRRNIRRSRAGPRTSPFPIRSSGSRASNARKSILANSMGRPSGRPSSCRACP